MENIRQLYSISPMRNDDRRIGQIMPMLPNKRNSSTGDHFRVALVPPTMLGRKRKRVAAVEVRVSLSFPRFAFSGLKKGKKRSFIQ